MTLEVIRSQLLKGARHGFFTRKGGASSGVFEGLNCGPGSSDQSDMVAINRGRVAQELDVAPDRLVTVHQVHSADVIALDAPPRDARARADGIVTATPGLAIAVLTADCQPVLFADPDARVIGVAHAGWKGALAGVLEATVSAMEALGARRARIRAVIGPTISQRAYEVGPEFLEQFLDDDPANARFFAGGAGDRAQFDLPAYGLKRLHDAGVAEAEWTRHCTYYDETRFYSYRRSTHRREADYGRMISAIRL